MTSPPTPGTSAPPADDALTLLQAVADPVRWAVLEALADGGLCVCSIQERIPVAGNLLSYHLKVLRGCGLVTATRRGRWVDYALAADAHVRLVAALPPASSAAAAPAAAVAPVPPAPPRR